MKVTAFIPCLIDQFFPDTAFSMLRVLEKCGVECQVLPSQTCCGQPGYNMGFHSDAKMLAEKFINIFAKTVPGPIIIPSGSCAAMVKKSYPGLFPDRDLGGLFSRVREFSEFLYNEGLFKKLDLIYKGAIFYHKSCHLLNEMEVDREPKGILGSISGLKYFESEMHQNTCCGFGGSFSATLPELSAEIGVSKLDFIKGLGVNTVVAGDAGCIMHLKSVASARGYSTRFMHIAEFLDCCSNHGSARKNGGESS